MSFMDIVKTKYPTILRETVVVALMLFMIWAVTYGLGGGLVDTINQLKG